MPEGPVIVNNTPLAALWSISQLALLRDLYDEALIHQRCMMNFWQQNDRCAKTF